MWGWGSERGGERIDRTGQGGHLFYMISPQMLAQGPSGRRLGEHVGGLDDAFRKHELDDAWEREGEDQRVG